MGYRAKQRIYGRRISNGQKTFNEMLNILTHQRNANQNNSKIPSYTCQNGKDKKTPRTVHVGEDVEQEEHSSTVGGNAVNGCKSGNIIVYKKQ
ncbi:hypothetical protein STEG23_020340 [Scotinomys teguina]